MIYEVGEMIGFGYFSSFFRLKKYPRLGVKVIIREPPSDRKCKKRLQKELVIAQMLRKLDVPVPRYVGVVKVKFPSKLDPLVENCPQREALRQDFISDLFRIEGKIKYGLVMEIIEADLSCIDKKVIEDYYEKEKKQLEKIGITFSHDTFISNNVLWSKKKKRLYFIDVEFWKIPWRLAWKLKANRIRKAVIRR